MWVSVVGVALGVGSVILVDSIFNGFVEEHRRILKGVQADIVVQPPPRMAGHDLRHERYHRDLRQRILAVPGVEGVSSRSFRPCLYPTDVELPIIIGFGQMSRGPVLKVVGIRPEEEQDVSRFDDYLSAVDEATGRRVLDIRDPFALGSDVDRDQFGNPGLHPILLGEKLARTLKLKRGGVVELVTFPADETAGRPAELEASKMISARFVLAGTFLTGKFDLDLNMAFMRVEDLAAFAKLPPTPDELALLVSDDVDVDELAETLRMELVPFGITRRAVSSWRERSEYVTGAVQNQRSILDLILFILVFVAAFTLLITLCMTVSEKQRDIGTLGALGGSRVGVASIFASCGLLVGLVGSGLGVAGGLILAGNVDAVHSWLTAHVTGQKLFTAEVYGFDEVPSKVDTGLVGTLVLASLTLTLVFSLVPAWIAGSQEPVGALRRH